MTKVNEKRCGIISFLGEPNVGKSTLVNQITGAKVSIVTHKAQTTRTRVRGIKVVNASQLILIDTPGVFTPKRRLDRAMVAAAWGGFGKADIFLFMLDSNSGLTNGGMEILRSLKTRTKTQTIPVLILNKIDKIHREKLLHLAKDVNAHYSFDKTFMISAKNGSGITDLINWLSMVVPVSPWLYPEDQIADFPLKIFAAEITREKLMIRLHQEIPYQLTVEPELWVEMQDGSTKIQQFIFVNNKRHKGIILGKNGETIKAISVAARKDLREWMGKEVHLFLQVKVRNNWFNEKHYFSNMGLSFIN